MFGTPLPSRQRSASPRASSHPDELALPWRQFQYCRYSAPHHTLPRTSLWTSQGSTTSHSRLLALAAPFVPPVPPAAPEPPEPPVSAASRTLVPPQLCPANVATTTHATAHAFALRRRTTVPSPRIVL